MILRRPPQAAHSLMSIAVARHLTVIETAVGCPETGIAAVPSNRRTRDGGLTTVIEISPTARNKVTRLQCLCTLRENERYDYNVIVRVAGRDFKVPS